MTKGARTSYRRRFFSTMKTFISFVCAGAIPLSFVAAQEGQKINVTMTEYKFDMPATAKAGRTSFVIKNAGRKVHNFKIKGEGIDQKLSANPKPGQTEILEVVLKPGTYDITCPVDFHTQKGMKTTLTVK
jgi:uncharacterized cupredoxin-like copper-binding protein